MANALSDRVNEKLGRAMEARGLSSGTPFRAPTDEELEMMRFEAEQQARESEWEKKYGGKIEGLEQPWLDPVDTLTGGIMSLPRGLASAGIDMAIDVPISLGLEGMFGDSDAAQAMFIGKRGLKKLGVNPERATVGQFSGLWDKQVRAELDDTAAAIHPLIMEGKVSDWHMGSQGIDVKETMAHPALYDAYQDLGEMSTQGNVSGGLSDYIAAVEGTRPSSTRGSYSDAGITLNTTPDELKPTMVHELQHGVQRREGFARGGSPEDFRSEYAVLNRQVESLNEEMSKALKVGDKELYHQLMNARSEIVPRIQELQGNHGIVGADQYERLAGEWEARNAGARAILPTDDPRLGQQIMEAETAFRGGNPFSTADDIPLDEMIVRMK